MPRYHFHVDEDPTLGEDGVELSNLAEAKCQAVKLAGQMICDSGAAFWEKRELKIIVTNAERLTLFTLTFVGADAPSIRG